MATLPVHALPSPVERKTSSLSPEQVFELARAREQALARLLMAFITSGLFFMLFPGTLLGVWNLLQISGRESVASLPPAWLQAHGHAQVFGWVASFILGIGFYSIPKLQGGARSSFLTSWVCWSMWTTGVSLRWAANVYLWYWRTLLPVSAVLELAAFLVFFRAVSRHRPDESGQKKLDSWIWVVISATFGLLLVLLTNVAGCFYVSFRGTTPAFPHVFDQRYLALIGWGFLVPFVWGFSAKWMQVFLGLRPVRTQWLLVAVAVNVAGLALTLTGLGSIGSWMFMAATATAIVALRMFEKSEREPKIRGVHSSFPFIIRLAYGWLLVSSVLALAAVRWDTSGGIWGASRHALTVGFVAVMILSVGQRILPAFAGMRLLWSTNLMFLGLLLLSVGCTLRVSCEVLAYQGYAKWAWSVLPASALIELSALTVFAINILGTFVLQPSHAQKQALVVAPINGRSQGR